MVDQSDLGGALLSTLLSPRNQPTGGFLGDPEVHGGLGGGRGEGGSPPRARFALVSSRLRHVQGPSQGTPKVQSKARPNPRQAGFTPATSESASREIRASRRIYPRGAAGVGGPAGGAHFVARGRAGGGALHGGVQGPGLPGREPGEVFSVWSCFFCFWVFGVLGFLGFGGWVVGFGWGGWWGLGGVVGGEWIKNLRITGSFRF